MEQQIKWLWLGLIISSAGWLGYKWVDFQSQVSSGHITVESIRAASDNQSVTEDNSLPPTNIQQSAQSQSTSQPTDLPNLSDNTALPDSENVNTSNNDQFIRVETDNFSILINRKGGTLSQLKLKKYSVSVQQKDIPTQLLKTGRQSYSLQSGLLSKQSASNHHAIYNSEKSEYVLEDNQDALTVPLIWQKDGVKVIKTYIFSPKSHQIQLKHTIENGGEQSWQGSSYAQLSRAQPTEDGDAFIHTYTGSAWWSEPTGFKKIDFDEMANESPTLSATEGWIAMIQHYFVSIILPSKDQENHFYTKRSNNQYIIGTVSPQQTVPVGESHQFQDTLFLGPKNQEELTAVHPNLDYAVDYGIFHIIAAPIFWVLDHIHDFIGNWGVAIILVTLLIKLLFFKLSEKSYRSMARMKLLAPRIQQLRERYGDDKQGMNQKMMQLYKEEKVNPLGGCLPVIIQIPVFISLYWVLIESVELRQAPFMLWINDLSISDPYFVMPIFMGLTMFIQQRLNPPPADPMQQKVMQFLPVIFTVFFLFFPAGLVLYWIINNVLSIAQQWYITKKIAEEKKT